MSRLPVWGVRSLGSGILKDTVTMVQADGRKVDPGSRGEGVTQHNALPRHCAVYGRGCAAVSLLFFLGML